MLLFPNERLMTGRKRTPERDAEIVRRYAAGEKVVVIALLDGCSEGTVCEVARRAGLPGRPPGPRLVAKPPKVSYAYCNWLRIYARYLGSPLPQRDV